MAYNSFVCVRYTGWSFGLCTNGNGQSDDVDDDLERNAVDCSASLVPKSSDDTQFLLTDNVTPRDVT